MPTCILMLTIHRIWTTLPAAVSEAHAQGSELWLSCPLPVTTRGCPACPCVDAATPDSPPSYRPEDIPIYTRRVDFVCGAIIVHKKHSWHSRCVIQQYRSVIFHLPD